MTADEIEETRSGLFNGAVWQSQSHMRAVLTYLCADDEWCLMSAPTKSVRIGRYVQIPHADINGKWRYTSEEITEHLRGWQFLPNHTLAPLSDRLFI